MLQAEQHGAEARADGTGDSDLQQASNAKANVVQRGKGMGAAGLGAHLRCQGHLRHGAVQAVWWPCSLLSTIKGCNKRVSVQPVVLILQTPFQRCMLFELWHRLVRLDAT